MNKTLSVLLLEDDQARVVAFRERLTTSGQPFGLTHHERATDAIAELCAGKRYDLILLDHDLGGRTYVDHTDNKEDCGMRVAEYFMIRPEQVRKHGPIVVHSLNGPAAQQMVELIGEAVWCPFIWQREIWAKYINFPRASDRSGTPQATEWSAEYSVERGPSSDAPQ
jgi:CheY-like chemotaxis protein